MILTHHGAESAVENLGGAGAPAHAWCRKWSSFNFFTAPLRKGEEGLLPIGQAISAIGW